MKSGTDPYLVCSTPPWTFSLRASWGLGSSSSEPDRGCLALPSLLSFSSSLARVDGDAAPPGRHAEEHEHERDDGGDQQPQQVEPGLLLGFVAAAQLAHGALPDSVGDDGWLVVGTWEKRGRRLPVPGAVLTTTDACWYGDSLETKLR